MEEKNFISFALEVCTYLKFAQIEFVEKVAANSMKNRDLLKAHSLRLL
jgi:hypothetical protein